MSFDQTVPAIELLFDEYTRILSNWAEADLRGEVDLFGRKATRGSQLVTLILNAHAVYRMQLFCYLKAFGREELNTMNLWAGVDGGM